MDDATPPHPLSSNLTMGRSYKLFSRRALALAAVLLTGTFAAGPACGQGGGSRFDLAGPRIDVHVQRGDTSLPIAMVPNLQPGDKLTIHADLPASQSVKMVLVVAFLRGSTNPPTDKFFTKIETWDKRVRNEGATVTVPEEAQQALIFLAPETGGDYSTLKSAVQGRPGIFVRAAQDLNEASFEQARIERYLQAIRRVPAGSSAELLDHSHKLAATLNLKPNDDCFKKSPDQQLSCLRQTGSQLLLDDGHGQTLASILATGDSANLIGAVAGTPMGGAGVYSAYVGTVIDLVRLMSGLHTAQFQYIPAIAFPDAETLNLRLNTAPSFHNPKSVIVVALPAIQPSVAPPLRLQDPSHVSCLLQPAMVLPLEGAPLVFATGFAHDLSLHLNGGTVDGKTDLPLMPDAFEGGLVLAAQTGRKPLGTSAPAPRDASTTATALPATLSPGKPFPDTTTGDVTITGTLRGSWGFDTFEGVTVPLQRRTGANWSAAPQGELFAGRLNQLALRADGTACASQIDLDLPGPDDRKLSWKQAAGDEHGKAAPVLEVKLPLEKTAPGNIDLLVHQYGTDAVAKVAFTAYSDRTKLASIHLHAGDNVATLTGNGLGDVAGIRIGDVDYTPLPTQAPDGKELRLAAKALSQHGGKGDTAKSKPGDAGTASVVLRDGRTLQVGYAVDAARPSLELLSHAAKPTSQTGLPLTGVNTTDLPLDATLTFALRSVAPDRFPRTEKVEIALADGSLHTTLSFEEGSLVLQDAHTALAYFSPAKAFGPSAYGPLQLRPLQQDGTPGDWVQLGALVRLPQLTALVCSKATTRGAAGAAQAAGEPSGCVLGGSNLFLVDSVSAEPTFASPSAVPLGFTGDSLQVPRPADGHTLYLHLRDDPAAVFSVAVPTTSAASVARRSAETTSALQPEGSRAPVRRGRTTTAAQSRASL